MRLFNQEQILAARSSGLKFVVVSAVAMTTALCTTSVVFAQAHTPLETTNVPTVPAVDLLGDPMRSEIAAEIEAQIMRGKIRRTLGNGISPGAKEAARMAYAQGVFAPLWSPQTAESLLQILPLAEENGLESTITEGALRDIIQNRFVGEASQRAAADLRLTALWLTMASKLSGGLSDEGEMVRSTESRPTRSELVDALRRAGQSDPIAELENYTTQTPQYGELKNSLRKYRQYAENGGWMQIRDGDDMLEPGMDDPRVPALRRRLAAEGYVNTIPFGWIYASVELNLEDAPTLYNDLLVEQVKAFQSAHGLERDGVLGPATLAALNESVESKIDRIKRAMSYWRENSDLGERYIWVNIPSYRAEAWTGNRLDISMKTIVGKKRTPSAAFSDEIEYIVVNPKWYLPIGLFKRQKLRKLRRDPGYAAAHNYEIYDRSSGAKVDPYTIDWDQPGVARTIQMVQTSGPHNALGQLKIIFPNRHSIYLHDTPNRDLFDRDVRALSSGCIRLDDPVAMANWLTDGDDAISTHVFNATLQSRERERFYLDEHVQVHLTYLPAVVNPDGQTEFPADIYQDFKVPVLAQGTYADDIVEQQVVDANEDTLMRTETLQ